MYTNTNTPRHAMPVNRAALRAYIRNATAAYIANGGKVQQCPPRKARGATGAHMWVLPASIGKARQGARAAS